MVDQRPDAAIGHMQIRAHDVKRSEAFYRGLGMRPIFSGPKMAILELRGGTHLLIFAEGDSEDVRDSAFDLMVDDVEQLRSRLLAEGLAVTELKASSVHKSFDVTDPDGRTISVCSSHVGEKPV